MDFGFRSTSEFTIMPLRPAYGSGEDWNFRSSLCKRRSICCARPTGRARIGTRARVVRPYLLWLLRPAYGSGEDWNGLWRDLGMRSGLLRPAYGSGEDWNKQKGAPCPAHGRCARPTGRARIGTSRRRTRGASPRVAPGLRVGRGLEHVRQAVDRALFDVAPGLRVGRGLEPEALPLRRPLGLRCARPTGRARIGTYGRASSRNGPARLRPAYGSGEDWNFVSIPMVSSLTRCARPTGRARIGTRSVTLTGPVAFVVAPGLRVGRGLEPLHGRLQEPQGQGCARPSGRARIGTGVGCSGKVQVFALRPAFGSGEDWNLQEHGFDPVTHRLLRPAFGSGEDWNPFFGLRVYPCFRLRPAFGSGEDWNH